MRLLENSFFSTISTLTKPRLIMVALLILAVSLVAFRVANSQKLVSSHSTQSNFNQSVRNSALNSSQASQASDNNQSANEETQPAGDTQQSGGTVIQVNGRTITVPPNTSYSQTFHDPDSQTSVSVNSSQHSSQSSSGSSSSVSSSSSSVEVNTQSP